MAKLSKKDIESIKAVDLEGWNGAEVRTDEQGKLYFSSNSASSTIIYPESFNNLISHMNTILHILNRQ